MIDGRWILLASATLLWAAPARPDAAAGMAALDRQDYETAFRELAPAADSGDPLAQFNLGVLHHKGLGTPRDDEQALAWFKKAAEHDMPEAAFAVGMMLSRGEGAEVDVVDAYGWLRRAARGGHEQARRALLRLSRLMTPEQAEEARRRADALAATR